MDTFDHLWEKADATRHALIAAGAATGFVAGFAMSAQPVQAQAGSVCWPGSGKTASPEPRRRGCG